MNNISNYNYKKNDEIDFQFLIKIIIRNKLIVASITVVFFIFATLFAFTKRRVWKGEFQIVLSQESRNNLLDPTLANQNLLNLAGIDLSNNKNNLETEVGILESSSVLMPIFDYVQNSKSQKKINFKLNFTDWKKDNLKIDLLKGTSILNISYKDTDQDLIIPVLNQISNTYQIYSGKNKKRDLNLAKQYLNNQIKFYKLKSAESLKDLQEYAIDQDLLIDSSFLSSLKNSYKFENFNGIPINNAGIGFLRVQAANEIKKINYIIEKIKQSKNNFEDLEYIAKSIPYLSETGITKKIDELNSRILKAQTLYTQKDINVKILLEERNQFRKSLEDKFIGFLNAEKIEWESILESTRRPQKVLLKYKKLLRESLGDEFTLIDLENQLRSIKLIEAKTEDPWELISKPNLYQKPVEPKKKYYAISGLLMGFIFGTIYAYYKEKNSGLIYEKKILEEISNSKILDEIDFTKKILRNYSSDIILNEIIGINYIDSIKIINKLDLEFNDFKSKIKFLFNDPKCSFEDNFISNQKKEKIILITKLGKISFEELNSLINRLSILDKSIYGIILVD